MSLKRADDSPVSILKIQNFMTYRTKFNLKKCIKKFQNVFFLTFCILCTFALSNNIRSYESINTELESFEKETIPPINL